MDKSKKGEFINLVSCAEPFFNPNPLYWNKTNKIPCRYCINCRIDRRKQWSERSKYEFKEKISGAFVTFTYDDAHLFSELLVKGNDNKVRATINYKHSKKFIDSIRSYIKRNEKIQNILCQPDFTYIGVGEYGHKGSVFDRPHFHILFFGLDFKYCEGIFKKFWKKGFIDSLPILKGGINYVLKYMDKQIIGKKGEWEAYKRYNVKPPKQFNSTGLGNGLYLNNYEKIQKNNGYYKSGIKLIPVPQYYKDLMGIRVDERENNNQAIARLKEWNIRKENPNKKIWDWKEYNRMKKEVQNEQIKFELKKMRALYQRMLNNGEQIINIYNLGENENE